jgi:pimeloyl-ACP methyl ester carboxylesterase
MKVTNEKVGAHSVRVWSAGTGTPLLYLHGWEQHPGSAPFLEKLANGRELRAPEHLGYGSSDTLDDIIDIVDIALHYRKLIEQWGKGPVDIIGHDIGGMFAAELAALAPQCVKKLVLVAPYGLWIDDQPLPDPFTQMPDKLNELKWADPALAAKEPSAIGESDGFNPGTWRMTNLAGATKFLWPIPDRGFKRRAPYASAPTLILRGEKDGLFPAPYEDAWKNAIKGAKVQRIAKAGHLPQIEAEDAFVSAVSDFLK